MVSSYIIFGAFCMASIIYKLKIQILEKKVTFTKMDSINIKGIAALCIMLSHYALWIESYFHIKLPPIFLLVKQLGGIGVLIFFFLSGYGIYMSSNEKTNLMWLIKRVGKVYFPYLFMKLIIVFINYCLIGRDKFILKNICKEITGIDFSDWFIWVIILQYIIYWISCCICSHKRLIVDFFLNLILMSVFIIMKLPSRWYNGLLLFWFGCLMAKYQKKVIALLGEYYYLKILLFLVVFLSLSIFYIFFNGGVLAECFKLLSGMVLGIILMAIFMRLSVYSPALDWIGNRSLFIYIIHINLWGIICHAVDNVILVLPLAISMAFLLTAICYTGYGFFSKICRRKKRTICRN